jgi:hypothetical protein
LILRNRAFALLSESMRRLLLVFALLLAIGAATFLALRRGPAEVASRPVTPPTAAAAMPAAQSAPPSPIAVDLARGLTGSMEIDYPLAAQLNAPASTIARDLDLLSQIFDNWRTNFPHEGNPVGENADITSALTGNNRLGLIVIPRNHRALNAQGELCDRWGTPFRFHQLSGSRMEIRSAGPDRKFATEDDAVWSPP